MGLFSSVAIGHTRGMAGADSRVAGGWSLFFVVLLACGPGGNTSDPRTGFGSDASVEASVDGSDDASVADADALVHDAELVSVELPETVECRDELEVYVNIANSGTSTWDDQFFVEVLESVGFDGETRVYLPEGRVTPGQEHTFVLRLSAPATPGRRTLRAGFFGRSRGLLNRHHQGLP